MQNETLSVSNPNNPRCGLCEDTGVVDDRPCHICRSSKYKAWQAEQRNLAEFGRRFAGKDLSNFEVRDPDSHKAIEEVKKYLESLRENVKRGRGLTIIGPVGVGKTHLAVGIKKHVEEHGIAFAMINCLNLIIECKRAMRRGSVSSLEPKKPHDEYDVLDYYARIPNLILDDFGVNKGSEWESECWYFLINTRYVEERATIVTSNQRFAEMEGGFGYYGQRIVSRLKEMNGRAIALISSDYRLDQRRTNERENSEGNRRGIDPKGI